MRILITRPASEVEDFAAKLQAAGHAVISSPMLHIELSDLPAIDPLKFQALIITSRNGLRALQKAGSHTSITGMKVFAVGAQTTQMARSLGFTDVIEGPKGAKELAIVVARHAQSQNGSLLHLCAKVPALDMGTILGGYGFDVKAQVAYRATPATAFEPEAAAALAGNSFDTVILMSPRTATTFTKLLASEDLINNTPSLQYVCMSKAVAAKLAPLALPKGRVHVPASPRTENLLALVNRISPQ